MDFVIRTDGKNDGFKFTCNTFYYTKQFDLKILSGIISPMQGTLLYPAENKFNYSPDLPSTRFNLNTDNSSKGFKYWYNLSDPITKPFTFTSPLITISGSNNSQNPYYNCCATCLIKPPVDNNDAGYDQDLTNSFDSLDLSNIERNAISRDFEIMNNIYDINHYIDSNKIDSAIYVVSGDTTFFGIYYYSKLLLLKDSIGLASSLISNAAINNNEEIKNYKILFPIITDGISNNNDSIWFSNNKDSLVSLSNKPGFIADQAKSILDFYTRNTTMELESIGYELEYNIYPTPFNASLSIEIETISSEIDTLKIQIIDQYGNEFVNQNEVITGYFPQNLSLNTSALPSGLYIVLLKYQDSTIRYQYVIKS